MTAVGLPVAPHTHTHTLHAKHTPHQRAIRPEAAGGIEAGSWRRKFKVAVFFLWMPGLKDE